MSRLLERKMRELIKVQHVALIVLASEHRPRHDSEEYWSTIDHKSCALILAGDTKIARNAVNKAKQLLDEIGMVLDAN